MYKRASTATVVAILGFLFTGCSGTANYLGAYPNQLVTQAADQRPGATLNQIVLVQNSSKGFTEFRWNGTSWSSNGSVTFCGSTYCNGKAIPDIAVAPLPPAPPPGSYVGQTAYVPIGNGWYAIYTWSGTAWSYIGKGYPCGAYMCGNNPPQG